MIYREFLAFLLAPLVLISVIAFTMRYRNAGQDIVHWLASVGLVVVLAVLYTSPWDGWIIRKSVWSYPPGSVWGTIGDVPVEEYLFMIGQTVITGLWTVTLAPSAPLRPLIVGYACKRKLPAIGWLLVAVTGGALAAIDSRTVYAGSMLVWFGPPLALQAAIGGDVLRAARVQRLRALSSTLALWVADAVAIHAGTWRISADYVVGVGFLGLPIEEVSFFLMTNVLIVNSLILLNAPLVRNRLRTKSWSVDETSFSR